MDGSRFDSLARALHEVRSRRGTFASLLGGTVGLLGLAETTAKKKKKKKKNKCTLLGGQVCGGACCFALEGEKCCDGACIPQSSCCLPGQVLAHKGRFDQCGECINGFLSKDPEACSKIDPDGCSICSGYQCIPGNEGLPCDGLSRCGICSGGLCENPA